MGLHINNNIEAQNTLRNLTTAQSMFSKSMQRLSSGKRVNSAADDAAGYAISQKLLAQSKGLDQASANSQDAISLIQTANGGIQTQLDLLQRMRQLSVQASNGTLNGTAGATGAATGDYAAIQLEGDQIAKEITQISSTTQFNNKQLLSGGAAGTNVTFQVGANAGETLSVTIGGSDATALTVATGAGAATAALDLSSATTLTNISTAINTLTQEAATLGSTQNRLTAAMSNLAIGSENMTAAYSAITNVNMAQESTALATAQILQQSSTAMLAQANQAPQGVLKLLG